MKIYKSVRIPKCCHRKALCLGWWTPSGDDGPVLCNQGGFSRGGDVGGASESIQVLGREGCWSP